MQETNPTNRNRRRIWIAVGVIAVIAIAAAGLFFAFGPASGQGEQEASTGDIVTAFIGDLSASATASGTVVANREVGLAMTSAGEVAAVFVEVGDVVAAGDELIRLESGALERAITSAEQALAIQEANLATLTKPPTAADLAAAEAAVTSAEAQLDELLAGPSEEDIAASEANVRAAQANVWAASEQLQLAQSGATEAEIAAAQADLIAAIGQQESTQELYDNLLKCFEFSRPDGKEFEICPGLGVPEEQTRFNLAAAQAEREAAQANLDALLAGPDADAVSIARASVGAAQAQLNAAEANHELLLKGASEAQIAAAEANLAQAEANLEALQDGPSAGQVTAAEVAVEQARISLQRAQRNLDEATLRAPFAGVITAVRVNEGEITSGIVVEMASSEDLEVILEVDEADIGRLAAGQPALITLEAWPDTEIQGEVASIAPEATEEGGAVVVYEVYLSLGEVELPVRVGMTANADLVTAEREDVLLLPNAAISADRNTGTFSVTLVTTNAEGERETQDVPVTIGLRDRTYTQITSGLEEGDQVLIGNALPVFDFESSEGPPPGAQQRRGDGSFGGE